MKIKIKDMPYEKVMALPRPAHKKPMRPNFLLRTIVWVASMLELISTGFRFVRHNMDKLDTKEPVLILMNHSSFIDLKIAFRIFYPKPFSIVCTYDSLMGKNLLMRMLGCVPTQKFVQDVALIRDMEYLLKEKKTSVLMYPEAGYSFDGRTTVLPRKLGVLLKKLNVPVVTVITHGAFSRDPLYNMLQKRKVKVSADVTCLLTREEIKSKTVAQLDALIDEAFSFDNFKWQQENNMVIDAPFRADGLHRILYKCPHCLEEGKTQGKGTQLTCHGCGKQYLLTELGKLRAVNGQTAFDHIPDWYDWERSQVRQELENGTYRMEEEVEVCMMIDHKALYRVGSGVLVHDREGFQLTGCDGQLEFSQGPLACHTINADFFWYEMGDVISIGDRDGMYYCFPKGGGIVTKARLAAEELYKLKKKHRGSQ